MKVARTRSFEDTVVEEAPEPALEAGDALVRVEACGLCGSDASAWYVNQKAPTVLGHEPTGVVEAVGAGCRLEVGQRVFVHHHVSCGTCHVCRRGFETSCAMFRATKLDPGGFAERVRVPRENVERDTLVLPESVSFEAGTFIEPLACSVRAVEKLPLRGGDSVLVIGLGVMGVLNGFLARRAGAGLVLGSDLTAWRRAHAAGWGFDASWDPRAPGFVEEVRARTGGRGVDHVIVGPSSEAALHQAFEVVGKGGSVSLFSPCSPELKVALPLNTIYFGELTLLASYSCAAKETRHALALIASGEVPVERLITHRLGLSEVGAGILRTAAPDEGWIRAVVYPNQRG